MELNTVAILSQIDELGEVQIREFCLKFKNLFTCENVSMRVPSLQSYLLS